MSSGLPPAGLVLLSPHLGLSGAGFDGPPRRSDDPMSNVDDAFAVWLADAYRGDANVDEPGLSPLSADLAGLAPTLVQVGSIDSTFEHGVRFVRRARLAGVSATLDVWPGLWHTWHYHRHLPEATNALDEAAAFIRALAGRELERSAGSE